jgi:DNA-binding response OmpR family regulator
MAEYVVAVVDDEPLAREDLCRIIGSDPGCSRLVQAGSAEDAVTLLQCEMPDIAFLDIQLASQTAFDVLQETDRRPVIVFATAWDHYALRAFDVEATDYILKPFDPPRVIAALERAKRVCDARRLGIDDAAVYCIPGFVVHSRDGVQTDDHQPVHLTPTAFRLLLLLLRRAGRVATREELTAAIWPNIWVEESNLTQNVFLLRKALGDDGTKFIRTEPARGYRFVAPVRVVRGGPRT